MLFGDRWKCVYKGENYEVWEFALMGWLDLFVRATKEVIEY